MNHSKDHGKDLLRSLSPQAFLAFGVDQIAYVRVVELMDRRAYALHAADGTPLTVIDSLEGALATAWQNDLDPVILN